MVLTVTPLLARHRPSIYFEPGDVRPAALTVSASRHQVDISHFVDLAEVTLCNERSRRHGAFRIHSHPAQTGQREFTHFQSTAEPSAKSPTSIVPSASLINGRT